ncbi:class I SAM-dependent methyltransferase [Kroppenstedtia eburnea]|uniref:class I SAM-dependent methyltransferase n=1 Tax=Kroppenstedtia eburnea TaxID=714067 RepID=UPI00020C83DB|nr:UbiE/COQ5 family methyltransferase [Desmospora sp. 8437]
MDAAKDRVRDQYQRSGDGYRESVIHAKGKDLEWIAEEIGPSSPPLLALDIATGAGHTAFVLSRVCRRVVGLDITPRMLEIAAEEADRRGLDNITWFEGDAENLPLPDRLFDLVTSRIAPHHFPHPEQAFAEARRVLVPGGRLILVDNIVPDDSATDRILNEVETLRDPSHQRVFPIVGWTRLLEAAGFSTVAHVRSWETPVQWREWMDRARTPTPSREQAWKLLQTAPESVQQKLGFDPTADDPTLILRKSMWICRK